MSFVLGLVGSAGAVLIVDQSGGALGLVAAQDYEPAYDDYDISPFDDSTTTMGYYIDTLTVYGTGGDYSKTTEAVGQIWNLLPGTAGAMVVMSSVAGVEDATHTLTIDFGNQFLAAGNYWITAWVDRPFGNGGGDYYANARLPVAGSELYFYNPGNGYGHGTNPVPFSGTVGEQRDLEFTLEGNPIPEPATMLLLATGLVGLVGFRKKFKK
jgi:hypothetical protein